MDIESKKEDIIDIFNYLPKRKISEIEKEFISLLIEKSKLQRELSMSILNKGFLIFFVLIILVYLSNLYGLLQQFYINLLFSLGLAVLIVSIILYYKALLKEERVINKLFESLLK